MSSPEMKFGNSIITGSDHRRMAQNIFFQFGSQLKNLKHPQTQMMAVNISKSPNLINLLVGC
jgi:hypothetical protein